MTFVYVRLARESVCGFLFFFFFFFFLDSWKCIRPLDVGFNCKGLWFAGKAVSVRHRQTETNRDTHRHTDTQTHRQGRGKKEGRERCTLWSLALHCVASHALAAKTKPGNMCDGGYFPPTMRRCLVALSLKALNGMATSAMAAARKMPHSICPTTKREGERGEGGRDAERGREREGGRERGGSE